MAAATECECFPGRVATLLDSGNGLLSRLYFKRKLLSSAGAKLKALHDPDYEKMRRMLKSKFPLHYGETVKMNKQFEHFQGHANDVCEELFDVYQTILGAMRHSAHTQALLRRALEPGGPLAHPAAPSIEMFPNLVEGVLNLLVVHVQLHILLSRVPDVKAIMALYACAYHCVNGVEDTGFAEASKFILRYEDKVMRSLQEDFFTLKGFDKVIGAMLISTHSAYLASVTTAQLLSRGVFNFVDDPVTPMDASVYAPLITSQNIPQWVMYGYLVCPGALFHPAPKRAVAMDFLKTVLSDTFIVPVFRDQVLYIHEEFHTLFGWFPSKAMEYKFDKGVKPRKIIAEAAAAATNMSGKHHKERRAMLRQSLELLNLLVEDSPGVLAPQAPAALACLAMSKAEIMWFFWHDPQIRQPPVIHKGGLLGALSGGPKAEYLPGDFHDTSIPSFIGLHVRVASMLERHWWDIARYHVEFLGDADLKALTHQMSKVGAASNVPIGVLSILKKMPDKNSISRDDEFDSLELDDMRKEWRKTEAVLSSQASTIDTSNMAWIARRMIITLLHSVLVDDTPTVMARYCTLQGLTFFPGVLQRVFENALSGSGGQPEYILDIIRVLNHSGMAVHRYCPEEQSVIREDAMRRANGWLNTITKRVTTLMEDLTVHRKMLDAQIDPLQAAHRQQMRSDAKERPLPGFESRPEYQGHTKIKSLKFLRATLQSLCQAIRGSGIEGEEGVVVGNRFYVPREYIREELEKWFKNRIMVASSKSYLNQEKGEVQPSQGGIGGVMFERPSKLVGYLDRLMHVMNFVGAHSGVDNTHITRRVLLDITGGGEGDLSNLIANWIAQFITNVMTPPASGGVAGVVYSEFTGGFVRVPSLYKATGAAHWSKTIDAESWLDRTELTSLCRLIGSRGFKIVEAKLLAICTEKAKMLRAILSKEVKSLSIFGDLASKHDPRCLEAGANFRGSDALVQTLIAMGNAIELRALMHECLSTTSEDYIPEIKRCVKDAHSTYGPTITSDIPTWSWDPICKGVDNLAWEVGINTSTVDYGLRNCIAQAGVESKQASDGSSTFGGVWTMLPYALACSFLHNPWKNADVVLELEAHQNNAHVVAVACFRVLASVVATATNEGNACAEGHLSPFDALLRNLLLQCLKVTSNVLLMMKAQGEAKEFRDYPIRGMFAFLERFVKVTPLLAYSDLESVLPYSILHAAYVDMSLGRRHGYESGINVQQFASMIAHANKIKRMADSAENPGAEGSQKAESNEGAGDSPNRQRTETAHTEASDGSLQRQPSHRKSRTLSFGRKKN